MLDTNHVFDRLKISKSIIQGTQDVGNMIRDSAVPLQEARRLFSNILGLDVQFTDEVYARVCAKAMVREVLSADCIVDEPELFLEEAHDYAKQFCADPKWSFLWAQPDSETALKADATVQVVEGIDVKVAIKADGKIKKGGKQPLALEMYRINVVEAAEPLTNQQFIKLIMDELDMTKPGATTYAYNCAKHFKGLAEEKK